MKILSIYYIIKRTKSLQVIFDLICGFTIWEIIKDSINNSTTYQVMTKLNFIEIENNDIAEINLAKKKNENILITTNPKDGVSFWNLKFPKFEYDLDYFQFRNRICQIDENEIILDGEIVKVLPVMSYLNMI